MDRRMNKWQAASGTASIWMIIPTFYPVIGGAQSQVYRVSKALMANGWPVQVLTRRHGYAGLHEGLTAVDQVDSIPVIRLYSRGPAKIGSLLYVLGGLWHLLRHGRRGIYHAHALGASGWLAVAARYLLGGRCIIKLRTGRSGYEKHCSSGLARWQFSTLLRLADCIVVVNREVERFVLALGIPATRVVRIPNAVETSQFYPASGAEEMATRRRLDLPAGKTIVLYVGRLEPVKGLDILLRAWALLPEHVRVNALLLIVGGGPEHEKLLGLADSLGVHESVLLTGSKQDVRDYYWAADIFVLPSRAEGLSNAMIEAMACGLPVVASNVGGAPDMVEEGKNGTLFEAESHNELAQKLASMFAMQNRWIEMGALARQSVELYADLLPTVGRLSEVYRSLL